MTFSRFFKAGFIAASTLVAFAGGTADHAASAKGNMLTDLLPAMLKHNAYIGIEGGQSYYNDVGLTRDTEYFHNRHYSFTTTNGSTYGMYFGIGNEITKFEIGVKQFDDMTKGDFWFYDLTAAMNGCTLVIDSSHSLDITNAANCAAVTAFVDTGGTIDSIEGSTTRDATYPFLAAKLATKIRGIDAYVRPGVVFAGNHDLNMDATIVYTADDGSTKSVKVSKGHSYEANPLFLGLGVQYPLHDSFDIGAEYQIVDNTSSINLNLTYKLG